MSVVLSTEQIMKRMSGQGLRITNQRKMLAKLFGEHTDFVSAKEVYKYMGGKIFKVFRCCKNFQKCMERDRKLATFATNGVGY